MLLDWTQYSRFVSNQVRDKCRKEGSAPTSTLKIPENSNLPATRGSAASLSKSDHAFTASMSLESGLDLLDGVDQKVSNKICIGVHFLLMIIKKNDQY